MSVQLINSNKNGFTLQVDFEYSRSMIEGEKHILNRLNKMGIKATEKLLEQFDNDGAPINVGNQTFTSKGVQGKTYQSPYGAIRVDRHIYQSHSGGKTYCPLEHDARIIITSTPKLAQMVSAKYTDNSVRSVERDLLENHDRHLNKSTIQDLCDAVGVFAIAKDESWDYDLPEFSNAVEGISIGLDGTCMLMKNDGWREAMTGTITFYDKFGERMHTIYTATPPEYGKAEFLKRFEKEILKVKEKYPNVYTLGLADGARENWPFLKKHTDHQLLDFYHVTEYIGSVGKLITGTLNEQDLWIENSCHKIKHNMGGASRLLGEMKELKKDLTKKIDKKIIDKAISYFSNNHNESRMQYYKLVDSVMPIGSGATEAACKVLVKERMCKSGMRWKNDGAKIVLFARSLRTTNGRWEQFWNKIDRYGFNIAA